ncbi:MAG: T9SS type A sorting domain-containing protein [Bacteroidetes bacterium]|nr:T9SS type A sorting domain-containing protein [Bacteroidota bacterium]
MKCVKNCVIGFSTFLILQASANCQSLTNVTIDGGSGDQSETSVAIDPNNSNVLMATWNDFSNGSYSQPGYAFSTDGGNTWIHQNLLTQGLNSGGYDGGFDPSCAIDASGREYYTFVNQYENTNEGSVKIEYTTDNGATWSGAIQVSSHTTGQDKPYMTVDNTNSVHSGNIYVAWTDLSASGESIIRLARSSDQGATWLNYHVQEVLTSSWPLATFAEPAVGPDGTLYVAYYVGSNSDGSAQIRVAKSTDGGQSFPVISTVQSINGLYQDNIGHLRVSSIPTIAVDPTTGYVYVAYTANDNGNYNIYFTRSTDKDSTWSAPQIATESTYEQEFFPWLTVNSEGVISLVYYEGTSTSVGAFCTQSYNHGTSFSGSDYQLSSEYSNPSEAQYPSDYIGVASDPQGEVWAVFMDYTTGTDADVYTAPNYFSGGDITQILTVPQGEKIVFAPGANTIFENGAALVLDGALVAEGTSSNPVTFTSSSGTWGGIQFNNSMSSQNIIRHAVIENASDGVYENNSDVLVDSSTFTNNGIGIYCYASSDSIFYNTISNSSNYAIYASNVTTSAYYRGNTLNNNEFTMYCNNATPSYAFNRSSDMASGITATSSNELNIWTEQPEGYDLRGYNVINCSGEPNVEAENYSVVYMGHDIDGGYNTLCESNFPYLDAVNHSNILADNNYWGASGPASVADGTSTISTANPLSSDPNNAGCSGALIATSLTNSSQTADTSQTSKQFWQAVSAGESGNPAQARSMLQTLISARYDNMYSPLALLYFDSFTNHADTSQYNGMITMLKSVAGRSAADSLKPFAIRLLAREAALSKDFAAANSYNTELVNNYPNSVNQMTALYDLMEYNLVVAKNSQEAQSYLSQLVSDYPGADLTKEAQYIMGATASASLTQRVTQKAVDREQQPMKTYLGEAYPNPFNPTTEISYQLPRNGQVTLKIYDVLGRLVSTLVEGYQSAGVHTVQFNGDNLASGVYFYRLTALGIAQVNKMILMK